MGWVKLSDDFPMHPKVVDVGPIGIAMYVAGLCYCNRYLTDGRIPPGAVPQLLDLSVQADMETRGEQDGATFAYVVAGRLIEAGLWIDEAPSFVVHDYAAYQPLKAAVLAERERERGRKARQRGSVRPVSQGDAA